MKFYFFQKINFQNSNTIETSNLKAKRIGKMKKRKNGEENEETKKYKRE